MGGTVGIPEGHAQRGPDAGTRVLVALCAASFLAALNFFAPTPFYPLIADDLGTTVPLLGQVTTLMVLLSAGLGLAIGPLADRYGYRWPLVIGVLAIATNLTVIGLAPSYPVLLLASAVGGLGDALAFGLPLAIAGMSFAGDAQRRAISWTLGSLSSAGIVGVLLLALLGDATTWRTALVAAGILSGGTALLVAWALPPDHQRPASRLQVRSLMGAYGPLLRHGPTVRQLGASGLRSVTWVGLLTYFGAFLAEEFAVSTRGIGAIYTVGSTGYLVGSFLGGRLLGSAVQRRVALLNLTMAGGVAALLWSSSVGMVVALWLVIGFLAAATGVGTAMLLVQETPAGAGTTMVFSGSMVNLGTAIGAALGGLFIALGGFHGLGLGLPIFAVAAAVVLWPRRPADRNASSAAGA